MVIGREWVDVCELRENHRERDRMAGLGSVMVI